MKYKSIENNLCAEDRRALVIETLINSETAVTASTLAEQFFVSRQIIVGDIAILRASGFDILATPKGYIINSINKSDFHFVETIVCSHTADQLKDELYTIVDYGGTVIDVSIEHSIYGNICGSLNLSSRHDVDVFIQRVNSTQNALPISTLTGGVHLHQIGLNDKAALSLIRTALYKKNILIK